MRTVLSCLAVISCVVFLASGYYYWKAKTNVSAFTEKQEPAIASEKDSNEVELNEEEPGGHSDLLRLASNWPKEAQETFAEALDKGRPYKLVIVGSAALGKEANGWSEMLKKELIRTYGESNLEVSIFEYSITSNVFIESGRDKEITELEPDLVLFEPFNLNDNTALIPTHQNHQNILEFISSLKGVHSKAVVILQPPHPIVSSGYPGQVDELKEFASKQELVYLDHWPMWLRTDDERLKDYLIYGQSAPNEKGHKIWNEFLREYFMSK